MRIVRVSTGVVWGLIFFVLCIVSDSNIATAVLYMSQENFTFPKEEINQFEQYECIITSFLCLNICFCFV